MKKIFFILLLILISSRLFAGGILYCRSGASGDGFTASSPSGDIQEAIKLAAAFGADELRVSGDFILYKGDNNSGLTIIKEGRTLKDLTISGGWNSSFSTQTGYSVLRGYNCTHVVYMENCKNVELSRFVITGGRAEGSYSVGYQTFEPEYGETVPDYVGGGIVIHDSQDFTLNCYVSNNIASIGSGIYIQESSGFTVSGLTVWNTSSTEYNGAYGMGIYIARCEDFSMEGFVWGNYFSSRDSGYFAYGDYGEGSGAYLSHCEGATIGGVFAYNTKSTWGAALTMDACSDCVITGAFTNNEVTTGEGGAVFLNDCDNITVNGVFSGNESELYGGALSLNLGNNIEIGGIFVENSATERGGAVYCDNGRNITFSGTFTENSASDGGAIYAQQTRNSSFTSDCIIQYNKCFSEGGGIYFDPTGCSANSILQGCVYSPNYKGSTEDNIYPENNPGVLRVP